MSSKSYHIIAIGGWILNIAGYLLVKNPVDASFMRGFGMGIVIISYLSLIIKNRQQKNEATAR
jgi:hypothetical protein